jgi:hypothetical protein
VRVRPKP